MWGFNDPWTYNVTHGTKKLTATTHWESSRTHHPFTAEVKIEWKLIKLSPTNLIYTVTPGCDIVKYADNPTLSTLFQKLDPSAETQLLTTGQGTERADENNSLVTAALYLALSEPKFPTGWFHAGQLLNCSKWWLIKQLTFFNHIESMYKAW